MKILMPDMLDSVMSDLQISDMGFALYQMAEPQDLSVWAMHMLNDQYEHLQVYPLYYQHRPADVNVGAMTEARANGVWALFQRWTACGHNRAHAKTPYGSNIFTAFLDEHGYLQADYLIMTEDLPYDKS